MPTRFALLVLLAALSGLVCPAAVHADADDDHELVARWQALRPETLERLHALAKWCAGAKLFRARADVYDAVLALEPDDEVARKWLKFTRQKDGTWFRKPSYKPARDMGKGRDRYEEKRAALVARFVTEARPLIEAAAYAGDRTLQRRWVLDAIRVAPGDPGLRELNGEVRDDSGVDGWILEETRRARERRPMLLKAAHDAVVDHPGTTASAPTQVDREGGIEWANVKQGERVRVLGTVDADEVDLLIKYCDATWPVFKAAFDRTPAGFRSSDRYAVGLPIYCLDSTPMGNELLAARGLTERKLEFVSPLVSVWIPKNGGLVIKWPVFEVRLEAGPKQILGVHSSRQFGIRSDRGWASEALDHYLTWLITGTRMIYSVADKDAKYAEKDPALPDYAAHIHEGGDWLEAGRLLLAGKDKPNLHLMAGKDVNTIETAEVLYGYCIVAYLIEGRPTGTREFLSGVGGTEGANLQKQIAEHFHTDADAFEARVRRWLFELKDLPER